MKNRKYLVVIGALMLLAAAVGCATKANAATKYHYTKDYTYTVKKGKVTIKAYRGKKKKVTIPSKIKGKKVTGLGERVFEKKNVTYVKVPDSVTSLQYMSFYFAKNLKKVSLSKNIKRIPNFCFEGCAKLESIKLPKKITGIGSCAFAGCKKLKKITIPEGVTSLGYQSFVRCTALTEVKMNSHIKKIDGEAFYGCNNLVSVGDVTLDEVSYSAFRDCKKLESKIILSNKCTKVGSSAFANCLKADIVIPENVKEIENFAFLNCKKLTSIVIPADFKKIGVYELGEFDPDYPDFDDEHTGFMRNRIGKNFDMCAYAGCSNVSRIEVKDTSGALIEENGILYNKDKTAVLYVVPTYKGTLDFLKKVDTIGYYAMSGLNQASIIIPDNIKEIREGAFYGAKCSQINWNKNVKRICRDVFSYSEITSLVVPEGVEELEEDAIANCKKCKTVSLPKSLKEMYHNSDERGVLMGMSALEKVDVAAGNAKYKSKNGLLFQGDTILLRYPAAKKGTTYKVPKKVSMGSFAFDCLKYLKKIEIKQGGAADSSYNFMSNCNGVTVKLPRSFDSFPSEGHTGDFPMFQDCKNCKALVYKNSKAHKFFKRMCRVDYPDSYKSMYAYKVIK